MADVEILLCHAGADVQVARTVAARLERGAEARVLLEECGAGTSLTVAEAWDSGINAAGIVLLLSPDSVPARADRGAWQSLLDHLENQGEPPLSVLVVRECGFPALLGRQRLFRWSEEPRDTLRALERWVLTLHPDDRAGKFEPARLPAFSGDEAEIWTAIVDRPGVFTLTGAGTARRAQVFARHARDHFRLIVWADCGGRTASAVLADLAHQLDVPMTGEPEELSKRIEQVLAAHRLLLLLDDVGDAAPVTLPEGARASILLIRHSGNALPDPGAEPSSAEARRLWAASSLCRPGGFPLDFAADIAGLDREDAREACSILVESRWWEPLDDIGPRYRLLHSCTDFGDDDLARRHAETLAARLERWRDHRDECHRLAAEFEAGLDRALDEDWQLALTLGGRAFTFLREEGRWGEAAATYSTLRAAALQRDDAAVAERCQWELSWIVDSAGLIRPRAVAGDQIAFDFT